MLIPQEKTALYYVPDQNDDTTVEMIMPGAAGPGQHRDTIHRDRVKYAIPEPTCPECGHPEPKGTNFTYNSQDYTCPKCKTQWREGYQLLTIIQVLNRDHKRVRDPRNETQTLTQIQTQEK